MSHHRRNGWVPRKLNELGFVGRGKSRHRPRNAPELYGGPYPFVQTAEIMASELYITSHAKTYSEAGLAQSKMWQAETLCMTIAGENTAETAILSYPACFPDSVVGFIADPARSDVRFVKYYLDYIKKQIRQVTRGATQDNLSLDKLLSFDIVAPPVEQQRKIASTAAAYDELILNDNRRIALLEEMAQTIYREWFVEFRFPGHKAIPLHDSHIGKIPDGWEIEPLGKVVEFQKGKKAVAVLPEGAADGVPYLLVDVMRDTAGAKSEYVDPDKMVLADEQDTIMVMDGSGSCDVFIGFSGAIGSTLGRYRPIGRRGISPYWLYCLFFDRTDDIRAKNIGAAIPHANKDFINSLDVAIPSADIFNLYEAVSQPAFSLRRLLRNRNTNLRATRNLLLPRLLSGELDVEDLDIDTGEAMTE
jgi:type I restriction enzyme, S subunit